MPQPDRGPNREIFRRAPYRTEGTLEQTHRSHRRALLAGDDEMVDDGEVDRFAGEREAAGDLSVGRTGRRIPARVIMSEDHARAAVAGGIGDQLAQRKGGPALVAVMARQMDTAGAVVDMRDPQIFALGIGFGETVGEEAAGRVEAVEQQRGFGTLMEHGAFIGQGSTPGDANRIRNDQTFCPLWTSIAPLPHSRRRLG